jgi:hypothetical protein
MEPPAPQSPEQRPQDAAFFRTVPKSAESYGTLPKDSEHFGNLPHASENVGVLTEEERATYTLTVRAAARIFESRGVPRSERSIQNWCKKVNGEPSRLVCRYDWNDRRFWITPESVDAVIAEEVAKQKLAGARIASGDHEESLPQSPAGFAKVRQDAETVRTAQYAPSSNRNHGEEQSEVTRRIAELERENFDLKVANRAKDQFIEMLREDRQEIAAERNNLISRVMQWALGSPEKSVLHIDPPKDLPPISSQQQSGEVDELYNMKTQDTNASPMPPRHVGEHPPAV